jgi:hypothetical protein
MPNSWVDQEIRQLQNRVFIKKGDVFMKNDNYNL